MALPVHCDGYCQHQQSSVMSHIEDPNPEPAYIDEELTRIGAHTHQLLKLQASLLRHRNHYHSHIYTLPPEVLSDIFSLMCTPKWASWEKFGEPTWQVIVLSSVSSHWRCIALQTPRLWNKLTLIVEQHTSEAKATLLHHFLKHGTNLDVSVGLRACRYTVGLEFQTPRLKTHAQHYQSIANILFAPGNAQKVTTLRLRNPPAEWSTKLSQLPHIHTLVLKGLEDVYNAPVALSFRPSQPLHRIRLSASTLHFYHGPKFNLPLSVEELLTDGIGHDAMLGLLYQCPGLISVRGSEGSLFRDPFNRITIPLTLDHLETLDWPAGQFLDPISIRNLSFPALKHLRLNNYRGYDDPPLVPIITLCHQLSATLKSLELSNFICLGDQHIKSLFRHDMPHLEVLKLVNWPMGELITAVQTLTPSKKEFRCHEVKSLPHLQSLILQADFGSESTDEGDDSGDDLPRVHNAVNAAEVSLTMLERRRAGELDPFYLDLPALRFGWDQKYVWSVKLQDRFRQVIRGRSLEIRQESEVLEWLY